MEPQPGHRDYFLRHDGYLKAGLTLGSSLLTGGLALSLPERNHGCSTGRSGTGYPVAGQPLPAIPPLLGVALLYFYEINKKMEDRLNRN